MAEQLGNALWPGELGSKGKIYFDFKWTAIAPPQGDVQKDERDALFIPTGICIAWKKCQLLVRAFASVCQGVCFLSFPELQVLAQSKQHIVS